MYPHNRICFLQNRGDAVGHLLEDLEQSYSFLKQQVVKHYFVLGIKWDPSILTFMIQHVLKCSGVRELVVLHSYLHIACTWKEAIPGREN